MVFTAVGMMAFLAATTLSIDVGMFMAARSQAQNAADSGALAGATALVYNSYLDRSTTGPIVQSAINAAQANKVIGMAPAVGPADVNFPLDPNGLNDRVQVTVYRAKNHQSTQIPTLMGSLFGVDTVDIAATAIAEAAPANAMTCVKPFMIPDKWHEIVDSTCTPDGSWTPNKTFDEFDKRGNKCSPPDYYIPAGTTGYTGYTTANDVGTTLVLREGNQNSLNPGFYFSWKMPGDIGGNFYRDNIANCNTDIITYDPNNPYYMVQEPGSKQGPTIQGIQDLIDKDPNAKWNPDCKCVVNSAYTGQSPRVFPIPLFDPQYYAEGMATGRGASFKLANFLGFFVDHIDNSNNQIYGIITAITGVVDPNAGPVPTDVFPRDIRLVK